MKKFLKTLEFAIWMYWNVFYMWSYYTKVNKLRAKGVIPEEIEAINSLQNTWGTRVLNHYKVKFNVTGLEKVPKEPVLFVSNHQSYADIPLFVAAIDRQIGFIAKAELSRIPIFGSWIRAVRSVFIERDDARASLKAIEQGTEYLNLGYTMGVFSEGTRSRGPKLQEFKKGSLRLAVKSGVKVVPVAINGSYRSYEEKGYPQPCDIDFAILDPIDTLNLSKHEASNLSEIVENIIREKLIELQGEGSPNKVSEVLI